MKCIDRKGQPYYIRPPIRLTLAVNLMGRWDRARDRYIVALVANVMTSLLQNLQGPFHILLFDQ